MNSATIFLSLDKSQEEEEKEEEKKTISRGVRAVARTPKKNLVTNYWKYVSEKFCYNFGKEQRKIY